MRCSLEDYGQRNGTAEPARPISIVIADDSELYREMLKMVVEACPGLEVLSTVGNGCQTLNVVAAQHPDLVLMDLGLPGLNGLQSLSLLREHHPATRVIIIASDDSDEVRATCLAQGADGFISKRHLHPELHLQIAEVFSEAAPRRFHVAG
jgi:DNA-binding NarL/FixJ family response regulator